MVRSRVFLTLPGYLSSDHDPLFEVHRWKANLRILDIEAIKSVPHIPIAHPSGRGCIDLFCHARSKQLREHTKRYHESAWIIE